MSAWIEGLPLSVPAGWLLAFALHATVLLLAVWLIERLGLLKHPGWAEWAWRVALFGAFVSMTVEVLPWNAMRASPAAATAVSAPVSRTMTGTTTAPTAAPVANDAQASAAMPHAAIAMPDIDAADVQAGFAPVALPLASDAIFAGLALWLSGTLLLLSRVLFQAASLLRLRRRLVRGARLLRCGGGKRRLGWGRRPGRDQLAVQGADLHAQCRDRQHHLVVDQLPDHRRPPEKPPALAVGR